MSGNRFVMLDTVHQCKMLTEYVQHLYVNNPTIGLAHPSRLLAMNLLWTLVSENMDSRNKMIQLGTNYDITRAAMLFGTRADAVNHNQRLFASQVIDVEFVQSIYDDMNVQLNTHEVFASYNQWSVINTGNNIVLAEEGDVRVLSWEEQNSRSGNEKVVSMDLGPAINHLQKELDKAYGTYPNIQVDAMVLDEIQTMFPQLKNVSPVQIGVDYGLAASYGLNISTWSNQYVNQTLCNYGIPSFRQYITQGITQEYTFNHSTKVITIGEYHEVDTGTVTDSDLARQLMRGDFLPRDERERAERYIQENNCL